MRASFAVAGTLAAALSVAPASAQEDDIFMQDITITPGDECVQDKVAQLAQPTLKRGETFTIAGDTLEQVKRDCIASDGPLDYRKDQTTATVTPLVRDADQCIWETFDRIAASMVDGAIPAFTSRLPVIITDYGVPGYILDYAPDDFAAIADKCERETNTRTDFFNGAGDLSLVVAVDAGKDFPEKERLEPGTTTLSVTLDFK